MKITLKDITVDNWRQSIKLETHEEQKNFVATNVYSIAQSKFYPKWTPMAIYHEADMVGFVLYGFDDDDKQWWIIRFMIDKQHQGKGYGKTAMLEILRHLKEKIEGNSVYLSFVPANTVAEKLYLNIGFVPTGKVEDGEIVMQYSYPTENR